ncbi:glycosyltransferase family 4 protein [Aestuariimicrobium ganziense]|uniref:glycosyltransferase family 4 protein n=1 Tax=Aestuariimicrobium ganziense TaxID=2773677 RepID=UPI001941446C|nr:glycosyltransferase family 4 protein [Aestuariimicrobium ganziense]
MPGRVVQPGRVVHLSTVHHCRDNRIHNKECQALAKAGFDITLVVHAEHDEPDACPPLVALPKSKGRLGRLLGGQRAAWRVLERLRPALLHVHDPELVPLAWLWRRLHGAKLIFDAHEDLVAQIETKSYLPAPVRPVAKLVAKVLVRWADQGFDGIVAATNDVAAGFRNPRTVVVHNYPWLSDFPLLEPAPGPGRVVYAGDLTEERKLTFMIDVVERVRVQRDDAHLVLAGRPLGGAQAALDRACSSCAVEHVGLLPPPEVPALVASASVGLIFLEPLPNYVRSLPTKLFEYMAAGVPFLASDFAFWRQEFEHWDAGRFADSSDVEACAQVLLEMLDDADARARMGANGRRAIEQGVNFEAEAPKLVALTRELLGTAG